MLGGCPSSLVAANQLVCHIGKTKSHPLASHWSLTNGALKLQ